MHYLQALIQPASLYSMRLPYTHQSALTYPLPPPSTVLGMLAAALQRVENRSPLECLEEIEAGIQTCAALIDEDVPIAARSCVVSLIKDLANALKTIRDPTKDEKPTDALPRQFAHTHQVTVVAFSADRDLLSRAANALQRAPITLGGSESLAAVPEVKVGEATVEHLEPGEHVSTRAYVPRDLLDGGSLQEHHSLFWVHERCLGAEELAAYLFPVTLAGHLYRPAPIRGVLGRGATGYAFDRSAIFAASRD